MAGQLQVVTGIATTLIALIAGLTLSVERLGPRLAPIARLTAVAVAVPLADRVRGLVAGVALAAGGRRGDGGGATGDGVRARGDRRQLLADDDRRRHHRHGRARALERAGARHRGDGRPAAAGALLREHAGGARGAEPRRPAGRGRHGRAAWSGRSAARWRSARWSGALFALYLRYVAREVPLVLLGVCALLSQTGSVQQFEPLLAAMAAGLVIENLSVAQGDALRAAVRQAAPPVLVVFFVGVGASLRLDAVTSTGLAVFVLVARPHRRDPARRRGRLARVRPGSAARQACVDGAGVAGGHHAGLRLGGRQRVRRLGRAGAAAARGRHRRERAGGAGGVPARPDPGGRAGSAGAAPAAGRVEPRAVSPRAPGGRQRRRAVRHRRRGGGAGCGDARAGRRVGGACRRRRRPRGDRRGRARARAAGPAGLHAAAAVDRRADVRGLLRRVRQRGAVAAVSPGGRAAEVPPRRLGRLPGSEPVVRQRDPPRARPAQSPGVHPGLPPGAGGAGAARASPRRAHGAVLAHPVALSRSAAHLPVERRDSAGPAGQRSAGVPGRARPAQLPGRRGRAAGRRGGGGVVARLPRRPPHHGGGRADWRGLRPHPDDCRRSRAADRAEAPAGAAGAGGRDRSAWASIGWTTRRAFRSGWRRSTRWSRAGPICAAA